MSVTLPNRAPASRTPAAEPARAAPAAPAPAAPPPASAPNPGPAARPAAAETDVRAARATFGASAEIARAAVQDKAPRSAAPLVADVRAGKAELRPGMQGPAVAEMQRRLGVQPTGLYGPTTLAAVQSFQEQQGLQPAAAGAVGRSTWAQLEANRPDPGPPAPAAAPGNSGVAAPAPANGAGRVDLDAFFKGGSNSPAAVVVGTSEGNRTPQGGFTASYKGHTDPGNGARNIGSFSYQVKQGGATTPQQADALWNQKLAAQMPAYQKAAKEAGLDPNNARLAANFADLYTQAPLAATGRGGFLDQMKTMARNGGPTPDNILAARMKSYVDPSTGRLDAPGFGNSPDRLRADQQRRMGALDSALSARGLTGGPQANTPAPTPARPAAPAARPSTPAAPVADTVAPPQLTPRDVPTPALDAAVAGGRVFKRGDEGPQVKELQRLLGFSEGGQTGKLGPTSEAAIKAFQRDNNIQQNGMVGPQTLAALHQAARAPKAQSVPLIDQHRMNNPNSGGYCGVATTLMAIGGKTGKVPVDTNNAAQLAAYGARMYTPGQGSSGELMAKTMRDYGVPARFSTNGSVSDIVQTLKSGQSVPLGVTNLSGTVMQDARSERYGALEAGQNHSRRFGDSGHWVAVTGFEGPADNPTGFIVNDPDTGARLRLTRQQLLNAGEGNGNLWVIRP